MPEAACATRSLGRRRANAQAVSSVGSGCVVSSGWCFTRPTKPTLSGYTASVVNPLPRETLRAICANSMAEGSVSSRTQRQK